MKQVLFFIFLTLNLVFNGEAALSDTSLSGLNRQWPKEEEKPKLGKDPFYLPPRKEIPKNVPAKKEESPREEFSLSGIIYSNDKAVAIINGRILRKGELINGYTITEIFRDKVVLSGKGEEVVLGVEKFTIKER